MKQWLIMLASLTLASLAHAGDLAGTWKTIDDKTGFVRAHIQIVKQPDGNYIGTLIEDFPGPGETPLVSCSKCPPPYTNKPIIGLQILHGFREDPDSPNNFIDGKLLDPRAGHIYKGKARLSPDGHLLRLRGYIGVSMLGRSQTWIRVE